MELRWKIFLQRQGTDETVPVGSVKRPVNGATRADFGLSLPKVVNSWQRCERDGQMARRFVSALQCPSLTRVQVAGALDQCGWVPSTIIDVISDSARGMRSLVTR